MLLKLRKATELNPDRPPVFCQHYLPIMQSAVSMLYAGGGTGKSYAAIRCGIEYALETGRKAALWLTEDSEGECRFRFCSIVEQDYLQHKNRLEENVRFIAGRPVPFTTMEGGNAVLTKQFWQIRLGLAEYGLLVIDPLLQFQGANENDNTHAGVMMGALKEWTDEEEKSILLIHHASKSKEGGIRARGAGEWVNGCRSVFLVEKIVTPSGEIDQFRKNDLKFTLVKDNGLSYFFRDPATGAISKNLRVFPEYKVPEKKAADNSLFLSFANHNNAKQPEGFERVEIDYFYGLHVLLKGGKAYSQYQFKDGYRLGKNNLGNATMICLDFDSGLSIEQAKTKFCKLQTLIITTKSHQIEKSGQKCDRFRVILPLSSPLTIPLCDYPDFLDFLNQSSGGEVDPSTKDLARFYFSSPENALCWYSDSEQRLNWEPIYRKMKQQRVRSEIERKIAQSNRDKKKSSYSKEPGNTLPKGTIFDTKQGRQSFEGLRDSLSIGEKVMCRCIEGIDHGDAGPHHLSAFVKKDSNGNVFYSCSGGRCAGYGTKWCED